MVLVYLGLSKSFSPSEQKTPFIANEVVLSNLFPGAPLTIILTQASQTGFLIKTYFMEIKVVYGFRPSEIVVVRTSPEFWQKNNKNLGMSLFSRDEREGKTSFHPMPPGTLFIGDPAFGYWTWSASGERIWKFYRAYRNMPTILGWGEFTPNYKFYKKAQGHLAQKIPFYGMDNEFGSNGFITQKVYKKALQEKEEQSIDFKTHLKKFFQLPHYLNSGAKS